MSDDPDGATGQNEHSPSGTNGESTMWGERLLTAMSVIFTLVLFGFVIWQASMTPAMAEPTASVTGTQPLPSGDVTVTVTFRNRQGVGLVRGTVEVDCDTPAPELTFDHVPVGDRRTGYVTCPPGTENANATVSTWIEA